MKKKVTLSLEEKEYSKFQKYCSEHAMNFSKKIELLIRDFLKDKKVVVFFFMFIFWLSLTSGISAVEISVDTFECGSFSCGTGWVGAWSYTGACAITSLGGALGSYHMRGEAGCDAYREFDSSSYAQLNVTFWATAQSLESGEHCYYSYYNGSDYIQLLDLTDGDDDSTHDFYSFDVSSYGLSSSSRIRVEAPPSGADYCSIDNLSMQGFGVADNIAPNFTGYLESPNNYSNYSLGQLYEFNVSVNDDNLDFVWIEFEGVNYTNLLNLGSVYMFNVSDLASGTYSYIWWANDTNSNLNNSGKRVYYVSKMQGNVGLYLDGVEDNLSVVYPSSSNISASTIYGAVSIFVSGSDKTTENNLDLVRGVGYYNVTAVSTGDENHSSESKTFYLTISKATSSCSLIFVPGNSLVYGTPVNVSASCNNPEASFVLYRNGTVVTSENNIYVGLGANYYIYKVNVSESENYSSASTLDYLGVAKAVGSVGLFLNEVADNLSINYPQSLNASAVTNYGTLTLYRNGTEVTSENNLEILLGANFYNYTAVSSGNENYSFSSVSYFVNQSKGVNYVDLFLNGLEDNISLTYLDSFIASGFSLGGNIELYRNGTQINSENGTSKILGVGYYKYKLNSTGNANYSSNFSGVEYFVEVSRADPSYTMNIGVNPSLSEIYGTFTRATGTETNTGDSDVNYTLWRDNVLVASTSPYEEQPLLLLDVGTYKYVFNTTVGANYSAGNVTVTLVISKDQSDVDLYLNDTQDNLTVLQYEGVLINATLVNGESNFYVYYNGTMIHNSSMNYTNTSFFDVPGIYNITVVYPDDKNFIGSSETYFVNVNPAPDTFGPTITIYEPVNTLYDNGTDILININSYDPSGVDSCWYNVDNATNYSIPSCVSTTFNVSGDGEHIVYVFSNDSLGNLKMAQVGFILDEEGINLLIYEPKSTKSSRIYIPVNYAVAGTNLTCWYLVKTSVGGLVIENTTIENCTNSSFNLSNDGDYIFVLYANNSLGTFVHGNSSFVVDTSPPPSSSSSSGGSSSGGSGGGVIPKNVLTSRVELIAGEIEDFFVQNVGVKKILTWPVRNNGTTFLNDCTFESRGNYSSWITYTETFGLSAGQSYEVVFDVNIPEDIFAGDYPLEVYLGCKETNVSEKFVIEVIGKTLNFEIVNIERVSPESVRVDYTIEDISGADQNVDLEFLLFDSEDMEVSNLVDDKFVGANSRGVFYSSLVISSELQGQLRLLINVNSETYSGFVQENVVLGSSISGFSIFDRFGGTDNLLSAFLVLLFLSFVYFIVRRIRNRREEAEKSAKEMIHEHKIKPEKERGKSGGERVSKEGKVKKMKKGGKINLAHRKGGKKI